MHIPGATPGSTTWALGEFLLGGAGLPAGNSGAAGAAVLGEALVNGFDDSQATGLEAVGGSIGLAIGGLAGAAIGTAIGWSIAGLVGGANDNSQSGSISSIGSGTGSLAHGLPN